MQFKYNKVGRKEYSERLEGSTRPKILEAENNYVSFGIIYCISAGFDNVLVLLFLFLGRM
jgi:hypothetical protein